MDYERIENALVEKVKDVFNEFGRLYPAPIPPKGLTAREMNAWKEEHVRPRILALRDLKGRYSTVLAHVRKHRVLLKDREAARDATEELRDELRHMRRAIDGGATLVAFDIERGWRALTTVTEDNGGSDRLIVDDIVGFEIGHPIWITLPKPMNTRKERASPPVVKRAMIKSVFADAVNASGRPRGTSGSIFLTDKVFVPVGSEVSGKSATREIGITTFKEGVIKSVNLRVDTASRANWVSFAYGDTERLPLAEMLDRLSKALNAADYYVGHSLNVDIGHLREIGFKVPARSVLDTFTLAALVPELNEVGLHGANLSALAAHFGIACERPHCGGNDSRYNMELFLAMVEAYGTEHD